MLSLNVGSNINQVAGWLTNVQRKQLPFATAGALTDTAFDVRKHAVERTFPRDFYIHNKRFPAAALRVDKANKRKLRAAVYDRLNLDYLVRASQGGMKVARDGQHIAIPVRDIGGRRGARGMPKSLRPKAVLAKKRTFINRTRKTGQLMILRRKTKKQRPLEGLYILEKQAKVPKQLRFYEDAAKVVQRRMVPNFKKSFERALRTARRL